MPRPHPALVRLAAGHEPEPGLIAPVDDGLLASAIDHGMHGLLWSWVRDHEPAYSERSTLAGVDVATRQRHARLWETLAKVHRDLAELGVDIAAVKGVTAEQRWYGRVGERPSTDVDVLVDPDASGRATEILGILEPSHPLRSEITELVQHDVMQSVNVRVDGVPVDLHFDLFKLGIPTRQRDVVWQRMAHFPLPDGTTVRVPDAEISLVHFLVHLNKDSFPRLLGFCDVARILGAEDLDWAFVERFLHAEGLDVVGYRSLTTVTRCLALPAPKLARVDGPRARMWGTVWPEAVTLLGGSDGHRSRRQDVMPFLARGRFGETLRWTWRRVFPRPVNVALRYPDIAGPYLWRLTRGRVQALRVRSDALRARHDPPAGPSTRTPGRDPCAVARLLRMRAQAEPLWLDVHGQSMGWAIPSGARVRVEPAGFPHRGEVWAFCDSRCTIVVHRYRGRVRGGLRFQGDARVRPDDVITTDQLIGQVVEIAPRQRPLRWGPLAGAVQRVPRLAIARAHRIARRIRPRAGE